MGNAVFELITNQIADAIAAGTEDFVMPWHHPGHDLATPFNAMSGIATEPRRDQASYIASWLKVLRNDPRAIFTAASKAQEAADFLARIPCEKAKSGAMAPDFSPRMGFSET
jgi:antirestriction protein ArdC